MSKIKSINKRAVCVVSGGLDSTVAAAIAKDAGYDLYFVFFDYGQKTIIKERKSVRTLAKYFQAKQLVEISLPWFKEFGGSALLDPETPLNEQNYRLEYVPFRNSQFLAIATGWAEVLDARVIVVGSTGGDHICPDNSRNYINAFQKVIKQGTMLNRDIKIMAPLVDTDKTGAVTIGLGLNVPFGLTWSCHNNNDLACGHCSNCLARIKAFNMNNMKDPINYGTKFE